MSIIIFADNILNFILTTCVIFYLEKNIRIKWLVKEELNINSTLLLLVIIFYNFDLFIKLCGLIITIHDRQINIFMHIYTMTPYVIINILFTLILISLTITMIANIYITVIYTDKGIKLKIIKNKTK